MDWAGWKTDQIFFNLEKRNYNHKTTEELKFPEVKSVTKEEEILKEIERFYKELYTSTTSFENMQFISYIENLDLKIRRVAS